MTLKKFIFLSIFIINIQLIFCIDKNTYYARFDDDTLFIGNNLIERKFLWNNGNLKTISIKDKKNCHSWINQKLSPDFFIPQQNQDAKNDKWFAEEIETAILPRHLAITVEYTLDHLQIRKVYRIYSDCPVIACDIYLRGEAKGKWVIKQKDPAELDYVESRNILSQYNEIPIIDQISLEGKHWSLNTVEFLDRSDFNNTMVKPYSGTSYTENTYRGNLLFCENMESDDGLFFLKEAPCSGVQLAYPGADFVTNFGHVRMIGLGVTPEDLNVDEWTKAYSAVVGVYSGGEIQRLTALQKYQKNFRKLLPERDEMIVMNTWGDRGSISRLTENFCKKQIEACARLGITHFQLDYGWQEGSDEGTYQHVYKKNPDFWTPNKQLFPNGLSPVIEKGKELGVDVCLYLNPSLSNDNEDWEKDADAIIKMYRDYGVRMFKIDGQKMPNKLAERRTRMMYDKVMRETDENVFFNIDITAGVRGGYFMFTEYGNLFLENRYTEWGNYYPYKTLRNLWMLSRYIPAEKLLIEFPNKWKNKDKYPENDPFAPINYSFEYLFATTMAAQPLVWMDVADLPAGAFTNQQLIKKYRTIQHDFHQGVILPIGDEPSGKSWTGFQSIRDDQGYLLIFREMSPNASAKIKTWLPAGRVVNLTPIAGDGDRIKQQVSDTGSVTLHLPKMNSFALYKYSTY
ncbi:alpha-galactosidase [Petrimonas sulfuriphila]|uniref:alpha-galactosidase n=1 Tax=Dysgonomonadaceae TaxID=2005520 RepID=UPI00257FA90E|nr:MULTISPECIES: alpha-galactosidase [unclassified Proteiniphilum]